MSDSDISKKKRKRKANIIPSDSDNEEDEVKYINFQYPNPPNKNNKLSRKEPKKTLTPGKI